MTNKLENLYARMALDNNENLEIALEIIRSEEDIKRHIFGKMIESFIIAFEKTKNKLNEETGDWEIKCNWVDSNVDATLLKNPLSSAKPIVLRRKHWGYETGVALALYKTSTIELWEFGIRSPKNGAINSKFYNSVRNAIIELNDLKELQNRFREITAVDDIWHTKNEWWWTAWTSLPDYFMARDNGKFKSYSVSSDNNRFMLYLNENSYLETICKDIEFLAHTADQIIN